MKRPLLLTDSSVDSALALNQWFQTQTEPVDLTVVYAYKLDHDAGQPLKAVVYKEARQQATDALTQWTNFLPQTCSDQVHTEVIPGDPGLILTMHLLLRQYDYCLMDFWQSELASAFVTCQHQISTQLQYLNLPEQTLCAA